MLSTALRDLVSAARLRFALAVTGGGGSVLGHLTATPGCSNILVEATVPYSQGAFLQYSKTEFTSHCSADAAVGIAREAFSRGSAAVSRAATSFNELVDQPTMGVGCTCTLQTTTPHRGDHRCFVSVWSPLLRRQYSLTLSKGTRTREEEDTIVSYLVLLSMAEAAALSLPAAAFAGLLDALGVTYGTWIVALSLAPDTVFMTDESPASPGGALLPLLVAGSLGGAAISLPAAPGSPSPSSLHPCPSVPFGTVLLSGSFNPLHHGHEHLLTVAHRCLTIRGLPVGPFAFELSVLNADKPPLAADVVATRAAQFANPMARDPSAGVSDAVFPVILSTAPLFVQKAALFPNSYFVVGFDTAVRLVDPKYYGKDPFAMCEALSDIRRAGCKFVVAGRTTPGLPFQTFDAMVDTVPGPLRSLFIPLTEEEFRVDLSSTEIRGRKA